jgi:Fe-S cluster assembly ATP-binding protein
MRQRKAPAPVLSVRDLKVQVDHKTILDSVNLHLSRRQNYILFGPNGSGKTTLLSAVMGLRPYEIAGGRIMFLGHNITRMDVDQRAKMGLSIGFQNPPEITGIKLGELLKMILGRGLKAGFTGEETELIDGFKLASFLNREINVGFSGGERKRAEILQLLFLKPRLLLLDEPDSGVDVQSLRLIATAIQDFVDRNKASALIVTHQGDILEYIKANFACILLNGRSHCFADPSRIFETIKKYGYEECVACQARVREPAG